VSFKISKFSVAYGGTSVIRSLTDNWHSGQITALIGCNGAGKSTLLKALAGLEPSTGLLHFDDAPMALADCRRDIAYMPQDTSATSSLTVLEVVLLGRLGTLGMRVPPAL
jgi:iron complex transport system ATP-binding protein